ncbi:MAG: hypothetical protein FD138_1754 [Planctomycetota bacterium]|nr:MAG: hypothetical protein FD138_1754 [Planctomycetota bacterium]
MAELCLTRRGTNWMGLYRGLKKKTAGTDWDVEVFTGSADELQSLGSPAILSVGLARVDQADLFFQTELGWRPGMRHSVVLLKFVTDLVEIGEPTWFVACSETTVKAWFRCSTWHEPQPQNPRH